MVLPLDRLEDLAGLGRVVVGENRLGEDRPERGEESLDRSCAQGFAHGVAREAPDVVWGGGRVRAKPFFPRDLGDAGQVLVARPRHIEGGQHLDRLRRHSADPQVVGGDEGTDAATDRDERNVNDGDPPAGRASRRSRCRWRSGRGLRSPGSHSRDTATGCAVLGLLIDLASP